MVTRMTVVAALAVATLSAAAPVRAAGFDGTWHCKANGDIPIGILTVAGTGYSFTAVRDGKWTPKPDDPGNGKGTLAASGVPESGPLKTVYEVTVSNSNTVLWLNNKTGTLMGCWPR